MPEKPKAKRKAKQYDSTKDHGDKGDYCIQVSEAYTYGSGSIEEVGVGKRKYFWLPLVGYRTKTGRYVDLGVRLETLKIRKKFWCVADDEVKNEAAKQAAHDAVLPFLELYREYRRRTKKRYEVLWEASGQKLPFLPVLPPDSNVAK